jgi:hypothetical protein
MMTTQQKADYKAYRAECRISNVQPVLADFLAGDIPSCVRYQIELQRPANRTETLASQSRHWLTAAAGA